MKKLLLGLTAMAGTFVYGQSLTGKVVDENQQPLPNANVYVSSLNEGTVTKPDGTFLIRTGVEGNYLVAFSYVGFQKQTIELLTDEFTTIALEPAPLEEVVIKAIRTDENAPIAQVTRTKAEIEQVYQGQDGAFLLEKLSPSIISYSESGTGFSNYGQMRLRGIDQSRINLTINGVPLNDMIDQGVFFSNFIDFGNSLESVQVQRGVGTSTNGVSSYAGSINVESVALDRQEPVTEVNLTAGSFGSYRSAVEYHSGRLDNNFAFYGRFSRIISDGYRDNTSTDAWSFFFSGGYIGKKHIIRFTAFDGRSRNGLAYSPVAISDIENDPRTNYQPLNDRDFFGQWMTQLQHTWSLNRGLTLTSTLYYAGAGGDFPVTYPVEETVLNPADSSFSSRTRTEGINYPLQNNHYGFMSNLLWEKSNLEIHAGVHAYTFLRENTENMMPDFSNPYYEENSRKDEVSGFIKAIYKTGRLSLFVDAQGRITQLTIFPDESFIGQEVDPITFPFAFFNPKAGATYQATDAIQVFASVGRSGREPTKIDILGGFQLGAFNLDQVQNSTVEAEYVTDFEAGLRLNKRSLGSINLRGNMNAFYMDFTNEIAPIGEFVPEGFIQLRKNIPNSIRYGIESIFTISNQQDNLGLTGDFTLMQSRIETYAPEASTEVFADVQQALTPQSVIRGELFWKPVSSLRLGFQGRYIGEMYMEPTNNPEFIIPESLVFDANINWNFFRKHELQLRVVNLTNQQYYVFGAPVDVDFDGINDEPGYIIQPPFSIFATVNLKF